MPPQGGPGGQPPMPPQGGPGGQPGMAHGGPGFGPMPPGMDVEGRLQDILSESQYKRYREIALQWEGPVAITHPPASEKLNLTESQREQLREIMRANREKMQPPAGDAPPKPEEMRARMEKNRKELGQKILALLTEEQKRSWEALKGREFKFEAEK